MKRYKPVEVSEVQLEDFIRQGADLIEEGLRYVDHQRMTDRGPLDVLLADSGNALVVAELKVVEDDGMLVQGIDYYDYLSRNVEGVARAYEKFGIDPTQPLRLILIAPSFSQTILNRCKWLDIPVSLFSYTCVKFEGSEDVTPIFHEVSVPGPVNPPIESYTLEERYEYVTDETARGRMRQFVVEIQGWDQKAINAEPIKYDISLKVNGRVFAYMCPRRKHFIVYTYDNDGEWSGYPIKDEEDLAPVSELMKASVARLG